MTSLGAILNFFFGEAGQLYTICSERATEADIIIRLSQSESSVYFFGRGRFCTHIFICNRNPSIRSEKKSASLLRQFTTMSSLRGISDYSH